MTPKEKAKDIYDMYKECFDCDFTATKYSLICVDEILNALNHDSLLETETGKYIISGFDAKEQIRATYYAEVKHEIKKLKK